MAKKVAKKTRRQSVAGKRLVVIGTSAGGIEALKTLLAELPADFPAAVLIVVHISPNSPSLLPNIFQRVTRLKLVLQSRDCDAIRAGNVYLAPPNFHLMVNDGHIRLSSGPRENRHRPAIDPLFRSAAEARGPNVIGVILTGNLGDGAAGLRVIKECGGITIVQNPNDAPFPDMPRNALERMKPDYVVPLSEMGALLSRVVEKPVRPLHKHVAARIKAESDVAQMDEWRNVLEHNGKPSQYACPDCHGVLWEVMEGGQVRFRCRVGHAYSLESLHESMSEASENALWIAMRALEEKISLLQRLGMDARKRHRLASARHFDERARELAPAVGTLHKLLEKIP